MNARIGNDVKQPELLKKRNLCPVTEHLFQAVMMDVYPRPAALVDFGIDSQRHYNALHRLIRCGWITAARLDWAMGNGPRLTKLVNSCAENPEKGIIFTTSYDDLIDEDNMDSEPMPPLEDDNFDDFDM